MAERYRRNKKDRSVLEFMYCFYFSFWAEKKPQPSGTLQKYMIVTYIPPQINK